MGVFHRLIPFRPAFPRRPARRIPARGIIESAGSAALVCCLALLTARASAAIHETTYTPRGREGELTFPATYRLWVPDGGEPLRGVIVHQHGCGGVPMSQSVTGVHDLQWQALAAKWRLGLLVPTYQAGDRDPCHNWCDPRKGSERAFLEALDGLAAASGHPELREVPWLLWGHSGGAFWASIMMHLHPQRTAAVWLRSGGAAHAWNRGGLKRPPQSDDVFEIPVVVNPGLEERDNPSHRSAWDASLAMIAEFRPRAAPVGFVPDPHSRHDCGESRYLAIPFFDRCLEARLPREPGAKLRPLDRSRDWVVPCDAAGSLGQATAAAKTTLAPEACVWLPDEGFARLWTAYVRNCEVIDDTPPPRPTGVSARRGQAGEVTLTWSCTADLESGLAHFVVSRDGTPIATIARTPLGRFGRPTFQGLTHGDTPVPPVPEMRFTDAAAATATTPPTYSVEAFNLVGLGSGAATATPTP